MVNWILIGVLVVAALIIMKFKEIRHQAGIMVGLGVLVFLVLTFGNIALVYDINLNTFDGFTYATKLYLAWLKQGFGNIGAATSYVIHQDWSLNASVMNATAQ